MVKLADYVSHNPLDMVRAEILLASFPHDGNIEVAILHGKPKTKARPRPNPKGGVFTPSKQDEAALAWELKQKFTYRDGPVAVGFLFYLPDRRVSDFDNYIKLAADAMTKAGAWKDDNLARCGGWWIDYDAEDPRTVIAVASLKGAA